MSEGRVAGRRTLKNWIGGEQRAPLGGRYLDDLEPATGDLLARIPDSGAEDVDLAVAAAGKAFPEWSSLSLQERASCLVRLANLVAEHSEALAEIESADTGKPLALAKQIDMARVEANLRFFAGAAQHWPADAHDMGPAGFNYTRREPLGVVALITPWNLPLYLLSWKLAPALMTGNCVVAKPSELTPLSADALWAMAKEAGIPPGVINLVHGSGVRCGQALVDHSEIKAISFTGGTRTGRMIAAAAAPRLVKTSLELGGKNPALVFADADLDQAVAGLVRAGYTNQGQVCLCCSRILVHEDLMEELSLRLTDAVANLAVGDPSSPDTDQGALISAEHQQKVLAYIDLAREQGGRILSGGKAHHPEGRCRQGYFVEPTLISGLPEHSCLHREEIFGPVVTLQSFASEDEAIELANSSDYGLAATIWTRDLATVQRTAARVKAGLVWVNGWLVRDLRTPFGGMKDSGLGREGGRWSLEFFTESKNIHLPAGV
ncbi:MAG: aldehyde dehydrogenase [Wenzhouxiangella sp.]|nr:aldehyde dehydrogenase [Wenzhouxiangella sp.]TVR91268.1 MAG: aldehyde dehydrogenase [Wenzhouxiangellaceae bacterium]